MITRESPKKKPMTRSAFLAHLTRLGACADAVTWARDTKGAPAQLWAKCERGDWMLWLAGRVCDRKLVVLSACDIARGAVAKHVKGNAKVTIEHQILILERWCDGLETDAAMRDARDVLWTNRQKLWADAAAYAYADAAAYAAAYAASAYADAAAYAYADAAAYAAAYAASADAVADAADAVASASARKKSLKASCVLVRARIPWATVEKGLAMGQSE